jgi:hypothetical protein
MIELYEEAALTDASVQWKHRVRLFSVFGSDVRIGERHRSKIAEGDGQSAAAEAACINPPNRWESTQASSSSSIAKSETGRIVLLSCTIPRSRQLSALHCAVTASQEPALPVLRPASDWAVAVAD